MNFPDRLLKLWMNWDEISLESHDIKATKMDLKKYNEAVLFIK